MFSKYPYTRIILGLVIVTRIRNIKGGSSYDAVELGDLEDVLVGSPEEKSARRMSQDTQSFPFAGGPRMVSMVLCGAALHCVHTWAAVCGFEDRLGYAQFNDVCHMIKFNCYYGLSFAPTPYCASFMLREAPDNFNGFNQIDSPEQNRNKPSAIENEEVTFGKVY